MIYVIETITTLKLSYTAKFTCFVKLLLVIIIRGCAHCVQESSISIIIDLIKSRDTIPCNKAKLSCKVSLSRNEILISPIRITGRSLTCTIKIFVYRKRIRHLGNRMSYSSSLSNMLFAINYGRLAVTSINNDPRDA